RPKSKRAGDGAAPRDGRDPAAMQTELMAFEQQVHAELLERMNLRVTGSINKSDSAFIDQTLAHLDQILERRVAEMSEELVTHTIHMHLHRLVIAEVVRQCQGKVQTDYLATDDGTVDTSREQTIREIVASIVDMMPLLFEPTSVNEDLTLAEEGFDELFEQVYASVPRDIRRYIIRRTVSKDIQDI